MGGKNKLRMEMGVKFGNMEYFSVARVGKKRDNLGGTSLVAQQERIHQPMQGIWV